MMAESESVQLCRVDVFIGRISQQPRERWIACLTDQEVARMRRFHQQSDQDRFALGRGAVRTLLAERLGTAPQSIQLSAGPHEKPELPNGEWQFNVSHSGDYVLIALSAKHPVGVDVEQITGRRPVDDLARRVFTADEYAHFTSLPRERQVEVFFQIWTLKEAVLKAIGSGLSIAPESFDVAFYPREPRLLHSPTGDHYALAGIDLGDVTHTAAVALRADRVEPKLHRLEL